MLEAVKKFFRTKPREAVLDILRRHTPAPVVWLFGKTQSGKTSIIKYLTGADEAEIGSGFRPCTRFSREYPFPTPEAPLITFLDTRGFDEAGYDPAEDVKAFDPRAHLIVVTVKATDHAVENLTRHLKVIRRAKPSRPVILAITCLHEVNPQDQHQQPYPYSSASGDATPTDLERTLTEQRRRFADLVDAVVPIDLTKPEEGYADINYGGEFLKTTLLEKLPHAYAETLRTMDAATNELSDEFSRRATPVILGYTTLASAIGAVPIPWVDLLVLPGLQTQMVNHLARLSGKPLNAKRFGEMAGSLGLGMLARQAVRELTKIIPVVGSVAAAALAAASTYALGKAFVKYYQAVHHGHVPDPHELKRYYNEQLKKAEQWWMRSHEKKDVP